jgi:hypothetical protein
MKRTGYKACGVCNERKNHLNHPGDHDFVDASKAGMSPIGKAREAYQKSEAHKRAYSDAREADVSGGQCLAHLAGAPGECSYDRVPHHALGRGAAGGLEAAERDGVVVMVCAFVNAAIEADPATRRWAERATFERDGVEYPFRMRTKQRRDPADEIAL